MLGAEIAKQTAISANKSSLSALDMINQCKTIDLDELADRYLSKAVPNNHDGGYFIDKLPS